MNWISINDRLPEVNENGKSKRLLLSFANADNVTAGYYKEDEEGGSFIFGTIPCLDLDLIVNAWAPCPKPYREVDET